MNSNDDIRDEYDFSKGVRGKYVERLKGGSNVVVLEPDLAERFPNDQAVNEALRELLRRRSEAEGAKAG